MKDTDIINPMSEDTMQLWGKQNRWVNEGDHLTGKCIDEIKNKVAKLTGETDLIDGYYTCRCGLEMFPPNLLNLRAIHMEDCKYGTLIKEEMEKCGQPTMPPGGWLNSNSLLGKRIKRSKEAHK